MTTDTAQPTPAPLPEQEEFIKRALQSHALLIAGPGTGKTLTLRLTTERLAKVGEVSDDAIVLVTLTRAMAEKLGRIPHGAAGTLHSFTLSQLNRLCESSGRWMAD